MIRKCPDCGEKRVAFSTRKTIARFFHPVLPFRAGRCVNCKRRRTDVNGLWLIVCLAGFFLALAYMSGIMSSLQYTRQKIGNEGDVAQQNVIRLPQEPQLENGNLEREPRKIHQLGDDLETLRYSNETLSQHLVEQEKIIAAKERQIGELSSRLDKLEQKVTTGSLQVEVKDAAGEAEESIVIQYIERWRMAWQSQDVNAYISRYISDFRPSNGLSHRAWRKDRQVKIVRPKTISVQIRDLRLQRLDDSRWRAIFKQTYKSNTYSDVVTKELILVKVDSGYLIAKEQKL